MGNNLTALDHVPAVGFVVVVGNVGLMIDDGSLPVVDGSTIPFSLHTQ